MKNYWLDKKEEREKKEVESDELWIYAGPEHSDFTYTEHTFAPNDYDFLIEDDDGKTKQEKTS